MVLTKNMITVQDKRIELLLSLLTFCNSTSAPTGTTTYTNQHLSICRSLHRCISGDLLKEVPQQSLIQNHARHLQDKDTSSSSVHSNTHNTKEGLEREVMNLFTKENFCIISYGLNKLQFKIFRSKHQLVCLCFFQYAANNKQWDRRTL